MEPPRDPAVVPPAVEGQASERLAPGEPGSHEVEMRVAGIECVVCARRLAAHLRRLPGVESAIANPRTGWLHLRLRSAEITENNLRVEVRRAGFVPDGASARLRVSGMHCPTCARAIERALGEQPGVEHVAVDVTTGQVQVDYLPERIGPNDFVQAAARLGFRVEGFEAEPPSWEEDSIEPRTSPEAPGRAGPPS